MTEKTKLILFLIIIFMQTFSSAVMAQAGPSALAYPQSILADSQNGHLWVADFSNNRVLRFNLFKLTGVADNMDPAIAGSFTLEQNYPNPFNSSTIISFSAGATGNAELIVTNPSGRTVTVLFRGTAEKGRQYRCSFNAERLSSGIYYYMLRTSGGLTVKKMCLCK